MKKTDIEKLLKAAKKEEADAGAVLREIYDELQPLLEFQPMGASAADDELTLWQDDEDLKQVLKQEEKRLQKEEEERENRIKELVAQQMPWAERRQTAFSVLYAFQKLDTDYKRITVDQLPAYVMDKVYKEADEEIKQGVFYAAALEAVAKFVSKILGETIKPQVLQTPNIQKISILTAQAANNLLEAEAKGETLTLEVTGKKAKKPAYIYMDVTKIPNIKGVDNLTRFDNSVLNAICTLYQNGTTRFTSESIYKILTGVNRVRVTDEKLKDIDRSIYKLWGTRVAIDLSEQRRLYKNLVLEGIDENIINVRRAKGHMVKPTGAPVKWTVWEILREPILYTYAQSINQIASFPLEYLSNSQATQQGINLRLALLRYIYMAQGGTGEIKLKYTTLFDDAGMIFSESNTKTAQVQTERARKTIEADLLQLKNKGLIKDFATYKSATDKKRLEGIKITVATCKKLPAKKK